MPATQVSASGFGDIAVLPVDESNVGHVNAAIVAIGVPKHATDKIKVNVKNLFIILPPRLSVRSNSKPDLTKNKFLSLMYLEKIVKNWYGIIKNAPLAPILIKTIN